MPENGTPHASQRKATGSVTFNHVHPQFLQYLFSPRFKLQHYKLQERIEEFIVLCGSNRTIVIVLKLLCGTIHIWRLPFYNLMI